MSDELIPFDIAPPAGVIKTDTPQGAEGRWIDTKNVRFVQGRPQKIGGWTRQTAVAMAGSPRTLHAWRDNSAQEYIAAGTFKKLYIFPQDFSQNDITPYSSSGTLTNPFSTTIGLNIVTVAHAVHGRNVGDAVNYSGAAAVGGITVNGAYTVSTVPGPNSYTITAATAATSTAGPGGGSVAYNYEIPIGVLFGSYGLGYGVGGYGLAGYGVARAASTLFIEPRVWSLDHFGQILLASFNQSGLYAWDPSASNPLTTRAAIVSDAPTDIRAMCVTPERFVVGLRANMQIAWCDQGNYQTWTPTANNVAGVRGVTEGTKLVGCRPLGGGVTLIWTDSALYLHQYTGTLATFDTRLAGRNCGLISPSAAVTVGSAAYWIGHANFFAFSGGSVQPIPNVENIRRLVFDALEPTSGYLCAAMYCQKFNEVWFFYSVQTSTEPGLYAMVNLADFSWAVGPLTRVGGTYFQHGDTRPYWAADDGHIYLHENGRDDNGAAMDALITLGPSGLENGKRIMDLEGLEPDFFEQSGVVEIDVNTWDRIRSPTDAPMETEQHMVSDTDQLLDLRLSGRYAGLTIRSNTLGGYFRLGKPTVYLKESGSRR